MRQLRLAFALTAVAAVTACASVPRLTAASDIHALMVAIRDGDRAAFDAHVDKPALKLQLRSRVLGETARAHGAGSWQAAGAAMAGPLVDLAVEALVRPQVFRAEAIRLGYDPNTAVPNALAIAAQVRSLGSGRACLSEVRGGPCVFDFADRGGVWRLVGYDGPLALAPPPKPPPKPAPKPAR